MALKVWFEDDVKNMLSAAALAANLLPGTSSPEDEAYVRGFNAAIGVMCTSFGVHLSRIAVSEKEDASQSRRSMTEHLLLAESLH